MSKTYNLYGHDNFFPIADLKNFSSTNKKVWPQIHQIFAGEHPSKFGEIAINMCVDTCQLRK